MLTLLEIIKRSTDFLAKHGVESPRLNAELLVGHALGLKRMQLYLQFERPLSEAELEKIRPLMKRRSLREPLQYITGTADFCGLTLKVDRRALIPRPETERLIELVGEKRPVAPATILDLGTGTGAIALALATRYPAAAITAVEASVAALALARENAAALGLESRVRWLESDWMAALPSGERFHLMVANPPYLSDAETRETEPEVREFEPLAALSAGPDGSAALVHLIRAGRERLEPGGLLALETGVAQHAQLLALARECGYATAESLRDLTGRDRYLFATVV
ncbi:MAG: peptide chain release factor N(5)-glutamine methyltransferase [Opitutales bacterium]